MRINGQSDDIITPLPFQEDSLRRLILGISKHPAFLNCSDCGTGKTYTTVLAAKHLKAIPAIICPKAAIPTWEEVLEKAKIKPLFVTNYERARLKTFPYCKNNGRFFQWEVPDRTLLVFDEAHRCKGQKSLNSKLLIGTKFSPNVRVLMLTATPADSPIDMKAFGCVLGLFKQPSQFWGWALSNGCARGKFGGLDYVGGDRGMQLIRDELVGKMERVTVDSIPDFPSCQLIVKRVPVSRASAIDKAYQNYLEVLKADAPIQIVEQLRARQLAEDQKLIPMIEMTKDHLAEDRSVVIFVNFAASLEQLVRAFPDAAVFIGKQKSKDRAANMSDFQNNRRHVALVMIQAGGEAISLHDVKQERERVALICPTFSAIQFKQACGRIHRAGGTRAIIEVLIAKNTIEEHVKRSLTRKQNRIDKLVDADLSVR